MKRDKALESFYGYWEVAPFLIPYDPAGTRLRGFLDFSQKKRNLEEAERIWDDAHKKIDEILNTIESQELEGHLDEAVLSPTLELAKNFVKPEILDNQYITEELFKSAVSVGIRLGLLDHHRVGENPRVAQGVYHSAKLYYKEDASKRLQIEGLTNEENPSSAVFDLMLDFSFYQARANLVS